MLPKLAFSLLLLISYAGFRVNLRDFGNGKCAFHCTCSEVARHSYLWKTGPGMQKGRTPGGSTGAADPQHLDRNIVRAAAFERQCQHIPAGSGESLFVDGGEQVVLVHHAPKAVG